MCMDGCRDAILARKRAEYKDMVPQWYDIAGSSDDDAGALRQVRIASGLTSCNCAIADVSLSHSAVHRVLARVQIHIASMLAGGICLLHS